MLISTTFLIKGAMTVGSYVAHHGVATKIAVGAPKLIKVYSLAELAAAAATACVIVGGIKWGEEKVINIKEGVKALESGDNERAFYEFGRLAFSLSRLGNTTPLAENLSEAMSRLGYSSDRINNVLTWVNSKEQDLSRVFVN